APVRPQSMDVDDKMKILMTELAGMRSLLEEQIAQTTAAQGGSNPVQEAVKTRLDKLGLSKSVSKSILNKINTQQSIGNCWNQAMSLLAQSLPVVAKDITDQGGVFAFVGPTGVGKTTTVGKLAARYVMKHGPEQVALITTDTYRIAAHDQLRALGAILKVPVKVVEEGESLKEIIDSFNNRSLVLIDTAGFRHGDPMLHQQLALVQQHRAVRSYLVMAANNQWQMLKASAHAYAGRGLSGAVLSKLDETTGLGEALSVIIEHDLPLAYST
ncbi:MAG: flagellar biosynthesis protein FlhF, partial [Cellvibrionaceae bacterium]|nr:flagellar biosynthesis protein FlhF [Cellvibrionaceae bacterium]